MLAKDAGRPPKRPSHALARTTRALTRTNSCTETGEKLRKLPPSTASIRQLPVVASPCVFLPCVLFADRLPDPSKFETRLSHFCFHTRTHTFFFFFSLILFSPTPSPAHLHHLSNSRLVRLIRYVACPPVFLGLNTGPAAGLLSLSSSRRCAARRRRRRRRTSTSRRENSSHSVSQSAPGTAAASQAPQTNRRSSSRQGSARSASSLEPQTTADTTQPVLRRVCSRVRRRINAYMTTCIERTEPLLYSCGLSRLLATYQHYRR